MIRHMPFACHSLDVDAHDGDMAQGAVRRGTGAGRAVTFREGVDGMAFFVHVLYEGGPARTADRLVVGRGFFPCDDDVGGDHESHASVAPDQIEFDAFEGAMEIESTLKKDEIDGHAIGETFGVEGKKKHFPSVEDFVEKFCVLHSRWLWRMGFLLLVR